MAGVSLEPVFGPSDVERFGERRPAGSLWSKRKIFGQRLTAWLKAIETLIVQWLARDAYKVHRFVRILIAQPANHLISWVSCHSGLRRKGPHISGVSGRVRAAHARERRALAPLSAQAARMSLRPVFNPSHVHLFLRGSGPSQGRGKPRTRFCSRQSCGRPLDRAISRVGVSSTGCWPARIARTISGER